MELYSCTKAKQTQPNKISKKPQKIKSASKSHTDSNSHYLKNASVCRANWVFKRHKRESASELKRARNFKEGYEQSLHIYTNKIRERERERVRAAIEGEAFEGSGGGLGFGAAPFGGPLRFGNEHSVFAVLFLPHCWIPTA